MRTIVLSAFILLFFTASSQTKNFIDQPYIEVNGKADTLIIPDEIFIWVQISESQNKREPLEETEKKMVQGLRTLGINTERDLATNDMGSYYQFAFFRKNIIKSRRYILKVGDAPIAGRVFMLLEDINISNAGIERVNHSEMSRLRNLVLTKAGENARARAIALTKPLNQVLGVAVYINDNDISEVRQAGRNHAMLEAKVKQEQERSFYGGGDVSNIGFEKIRIASDVNVKFLLK